MGTLDIKSTGAQVVLRRKASAPKRSVRAVSVVALLFLSVFSAPTLANEPCTTLRHISAERRRVLRAENRILATPQRNAADRRKIDAAEVYLKDNEWPVTPSTTDETLYSFKPADFDNDGHVDGLTARCGASSWNMLCTLTLDRGHGAKVELQAGWTYFVRINGHFYAIWDHYGPEGRSGLYDPDTDFSRYFRPTSRAFKEVCRAHRMIGNIR